MITSIDITNKLKLKHQTKNLFDYLMKKYKSARKHNSNSCILKSFQVFDKKTIMSSWNNFVKLRDMLPKSTDRPIFNADRLILDTYRVIKTSATFHDKDF